MPLFTAGSTCGNGTIISVEERPTIISHDTDAEVNQHRLNIGSEMGQTSSTRGDEKRELRSKDLTWET